MICRLNLNNRSHLLYFTYQKWGTRIVRLMPWMRELIDNIIKNSIIIIQGIIYLPMKILTKDYMIHFTEITQTTNLHWIKCQLNQCIRLEGPCFILNWTYHVTITEFGVHLPILWYNIQSHNRTDDRFEWNNYSVDQTLDTNMFIIKFFGYYMCETSNWKKMLQKISCILICLYHILIL